MLEDTETAKGQLQRVDHLIYVTLKYTRTADVILNTIQRLIEAIHYIFDDILEVAKKKKMIDVLPRTSLEKAKLLEDKIFKNDKHVKNWIRLYRMLITISNATITGREEYRKNVTLIADKVEVNQERLMEFFNQTKEFYAFSQEWTASQGFKKEV